MFISGIIIILHVFATISLAHELRTTCIESCADNALLHSPARNHGSILPTVDIFYLFLNSGKHTPYITHGYFWILPWIAKRLARQEGNLLDTRVHIISNDDEIVHFAERYEYHSYNLNRRIVEAWNEKAKVTEQVKPITRILVLDGDVLMSMNAAQFYHNVLIAFTKPHDVHNPLIRDVKYDDSGYELIGIALGVCNLFSNRGIKSFSDFLQEWFTGSTEEVVRRSKEIGGIYFSDMELFKQYINRDKVTRSGCVLFEKESCYHKLLKCRPEYSLRDYFKDAVSPQFFIDGKPILTDKWLELQNFTSKTEHPSFGIQSQNSQFPLCFLHFQGRESKNAMIVYGRVIENILNAYKHHGKASKFEVYFLKHDLIIQPQHSRELFLINSTDGGKYSIISMDAFFARNYSVGNIIPHVPHWLLHLFPYSGMMNEHGTKS